MVSMSCIILNSIQMARTQKNKATAHHLGLLKAKLAKLKRELLDPSKGSGGGGAGEGIVFRFSTHTPFMMHHIRVSLVLIYDVRF